MFEAGRLIDPVHLEQVFAVVSDNSIFVASSLLSDPYDIPLETEIRRVHGNIGQPGLSFLIPPPDPRIKKSSPTSWSVIDHKSFDGASADSFRYTSVHMQLTQYQPELRSLNKDEHQIDQSVTLRETLVQVYDSQTWIADLDLLGALQSNAVSRVAACTDDAHSSKEYSAVFENEIELAVVDNWEELLMPPIDHKPLVIRASGNWLARLAAVGVAVRLGKQVRIVSQSICWECVKAIVQNMGSHQDCIFVM